ncbi:cytosine permease [Spirulina subsalsa FACHB-351]|uniref:Cytosine permease n=1 Tax=Spirulina subsalsa FACHB-351 TaxID=234711 RepID=A0ABT3L7I8_9CYAN|nr:cytosine permease [Spirulina subsalsa]MCW6037473.1 cytosine permease [Spirulina subsalsa FACHB-351]
MLQPELSEQVEKSEDYPLSPVPRESRKSLISLAPLLIGFTLYSGTLFAGGLVGPAFRFFPDLLLVILLGNLILGTYSAFLGYIAGKTGLNTVLMARFSFGNLGSRWVDFILGFTQIGWYAWGSGLIADLLNQLVGFPKSLNWLLILLVTYGFCVTAYIGYKGLDWLSRIAVPAMVILMVWSLTIATQDVGGWGGMQNLVPSGELPLSAAITIIVGTFVSGGTQATNWSRFANSGKIGGLATFMAFFLGNGFLIFSGAYCALAYNQADIVQVMAQQGLLMGGILLFFLNMWTTQDNTIYAFSVAGCHAFRTEKRHLMVLGGATFALALTFGGIYGSEQFINFLLLLGTFIPPIGGVIIADFWLNHRAGFPSLTTPQVAWNMSGITAYILASALAYFTPGIKPVYGILAAIVLYFVLNRIKPIITSKT